MRINELIDNSNSKLRSSELLADVGDYSTGTAILVTAFEEKTKALVLQLTDFGFPLVNDISDLDYIFKHHDMRHFIGFFVDCLYEIFDDALQFALKVMRDREFRETVLIRKWSDEMNIEAFQWFNSKCESFLKKVDFYQNIERQRQCGLYVDVIRNITPNTRITRDDFFFVKERLNAIHKMSDDLKEFSVQLEPDFMKTFNETKVKLVEMNVPSFVVQGIELVKKERNGAFKRIRKIIRDFNDELNGMQQFHSENPSK